MKVIRIALLRVFFVTVSAFYSPHLNTTIGAVQFFRPPRTLELDHRIHHLEHSLQNPVLNLEDNKLKIKILYIRTAAPLALHCT